jgi:outer membrane protein TolC
MIVATALALGLNDVALAADTPPLTVGAAIAEADANNPDVLAARQAIEVQLARLEQAAPSALRAEASDASSPDVPGGLGELKIHSIGVLQQFDPPGVLAASRRAASAGVDGVKASFAVERRDIEGRVVDAFYALVGATALVAVNEENVGVTKQFVESARKRVRAGAAGNFELLRVMNELRRAQTDLMRAQADEQSARIELNALLGRLPDVQTIVATGRTDLTAQSMDELIARALLSDPQTAVIRAQLAQSTAEQRASQLRRLPSLSVGVGTQMTTAATFPSSSKGAAISASLSIPLFDYGTIRGAVREAQANSAVATLQLQGRQFAVREQVTQAIAALRAARAQLEFARDSQTQAVKALQVAEYGYRQGALGALDVLAARNAAIAARGQAERSAAEAAAGVARLELIEGTTPSP